MQQLIYAYPEVRSTEDLDAHVGLVHPLESPFNLFLNLHQLNDPRRRHVYFFIYSMGARRIIVWGVYDKTSQTFTVDNACRYKGPQLYGMTTAWTKEGYSYIGNTVVNRLRHSIAKQFGREVMRYSEYARLKYLLTYLEGRISQAEYERTYGPLPDLPDDPYDLLDYSMDLSDELKREEAFINLTDINQSFDRNTMQLLTGITERFKELVSRGAIGTKEYDDLLSICPEYEVCSRQLNDECAVYFYGRPDLGYLHPEDPENFL